MACLNDQTVQAVVDGEATDESRQHATSCEQCASRVAARRLEMATLIATGRADGDVPAALAGRVRRAIEADGVTGATTLRSTAPRGRRFARLGAALATAAAIALVVFVWLPRVGAPTTLSAAEILNRSLATMTNASGVERLEYELVVSGAGMPQGAHRIEHLIDHDTPSRFRLSTIGPDGAVQSAVAQDPATGLRSQLVRVDGRNYVITVATTSPLPALPQMVQAQMEAVIGMMQATADQKLSIVQAPEGPQYVVEIPPLIPSGSAAAVDLYEARAVIDGSDFRIREFHASGALLKQPYTVTFRLIHREEGSAVPPESFAIQPGPGDVVLQAEPSGEPWTDALGAALREISRLRAGR